MQYIQTILLLSSLLVTVSGHTYLVSPAPFRAKENPNSKNVDFDLASPLSGAGAFPCKGAHTAALADPTGEGKPTANWKTGEDVTFTFSGGAKHDGGSCQAALSTDSGASWKVLHSWEGGCPLSSVSFKVPGDAPTGTALGAWTWFNKVGNREMYMNCFAVDIQKGSGGSSAAPFSSRPNLFVANIGTNTCQVLAGKQASFPNPGPDVTGTGDADSLSGECGASSGGSPPADGKSPSPTGAPAGDSGPKPTTILKSTTSVAGSRPSGSVSSGPQASPPAGGVTITPIAGSSGSTAPAGGISMDGTCGGATGQKCAGMNCCSSSGFCGSSPAHCGTGCQPAFGTCAAPKIRGRGVNVSRKN
ncbi:hypothetical protein ONS95_006324 [Cadophora gregata]|uniref:uncharacterized protein n=1 Tax=Cadophora gregata TaxID=51156 RepID=UPI0026DCBFA0|nr:uncharacterized protein ONS95_006324 [Cadophora gregata]KAK0099316.1 hypothetical protein ONS96_008544 [Cadophora gregata f. sp. sojae]KAK0102722.1 hypothetical protein ONS95_006324 [Cadophora gregata]